MHKKTVLITGAAGFAGHHMANYFLNDGQNDYNTVLTYHNQIPIHAKTDTAFKCDLANLDACFNIIESVRPDVIVHCAGAVPKKGQHTYYEAFHKANVETIGNLVNACTLADCKAHFILPSTAAIYPVENFAQNEDVQLTVSDLIRDESVVHKFLESEVKPFEEMNPYGKSKYHGEQVLQHYNGPWTILRKPTVVGPDDTRGNFAYEAIYHALNETDFDTTDKFSAANLGHVREYVTVNDIYRAVDTVIKTPESRGEIFNIGTNQALSGYQVVNHVADLSANFLQESVFICMPDPDEISLKSSIVLDCSKAERILGFTAEDKDENIFRNVTHSSVKTTSKAAATTKLKTILAL